MKFLLRTSRKKERKVVFDKDEGIREDTTIEALSRLKPVFKTNGGVTVGNSSQLNDGASVFVVVSESFVKRIWARVSCDY